MVWGVPLIFITPSAENACFGGIWGSGGWSQGVPICIHYRCFYPLSTSLCPQKPSIHNWYTQCDSPCFGGGYTPGFHRWGYVIQCIHIRYTGAYIWCFRGYTVYRVSVGIGWWEGPKTAILYTPVFVACFKGYTRVPIQKGSYLGSPLGGWFIYGFTYFWGSVFWGCTQLYTQSNVSFWGVPLDLGSEGV